MQVEGRVGPILVADGSLVCERLDRSGANVSANAHPMYGEPTLRGGMMVVSNAVAGLTPGTAFSATPPLALWNPPSSGKNLVILRATLGFVSGTLGAGTIAYGIVPSQTTIPSGGTELVPNNCLLGFPRGVGRAFTGSTFVGAPTIIRPAFLCGAFAAATALMPGACTDLLDGEFVVAQGAAIALQAAAMGSGTSPLVVLALTWEEVNA